MLELLCWITGCEFKVDDAPHVDACIQAFREHFRGAHPTRYLNVRETGQMAQRYNQTFEEYMEMQLGPQWADPNYVNDARYYAQSVARVREGVPPLYRQATIDAATAWIAANQPAQGVADAAAAAPRFRPGRRPYRIQPGRRR